MTISPRQIITIIGVIVIILLVVILSPFAIVQPGERGIVLQFGKIQRIIDEGIHWRTPLIENVVKLDVKTKVENVESAEASKDLQNVSAKVALNYNLIPENVGELWNQIGKDYKIRIIDPAIQESVKAATAKYTAEELITKREEVRDEIKTSLYERLSKEYINVTEVSIVNFDFSQSFNQAIESKVTAEQNALAAKNKLEQVKFEAEQRVAQATAEAEAIKIQAQAITQQGGDNYVALKSVEKWNGQLPINLYGSAPIPFLQIQQ